MNKSQKLLLRFILFNIILIIVSFYIAYIIHKKTVKNKNNTFLDWFNQGKVTIKGLFVSLIFGMVFGFMDNFFLWMGVDKMMAFIPGGTLTKGAWGNTYSDFIGATVGAAIASIGQNLLNSDPSPPIWIIAIAMPLGCILGMYACMFIT